MTDAVDNMPDEIAAWRFVPERADEWLHGGWSLEHDRKTVSYRRSDIPAKVKPLVWGDVGTDGSIGAKPTEQNGYFIIKTKGDAYRVYGITGVSDGGTEYVGLDEAKAAAQVHHDALIQSALVTQGEE